MEPTSNRLVGVVKWFGNQANGRDEGFIEYPRHGDIYFNLRSLVSDETQRSFGQGNLVSFNVEPNRRDPSRYYAANLRTLERESDAAILFEELSRRLIPSFLQNPVDADFGSRIRGVERAVRLRLTELFSRLAGTPSWLTSASKFQQEILGATVEVAKTLSHTTFPPNLFQWCNGLWLQGEEEKWLGQFIELVPSLASTLWLEGYKVEFSLAIFSVHYLQLEHDTQVKILERLTIGERNNLLDYVINLWWEAQTSIRETGNALVDENSVTYHANETASNQGAIAPFLSQTLSLFASELININLLDIQETEKTEVALSVQRAVNRVKTYFRYAPEALGFSKETILKFAEKACELAPDSKENVVGLLKRTADDETLFYFWDKELLSSPPIDYTAKRLAEEMQTTAASILLGRCSIEDQSTLLFKMLYDAEEHSADGIVVTTFLQRILELSRSTESSVTQAVKERVCNLARAYQQMDLWLDGYVEQLAFNEWKPYIITLNAERQKLFLKKVFREIHLGKTTLTPLEIINLNLVDYQTAKAAGGPGILDCSSSVVLQALRAMITEQQPREGEKDYEYKRRLQRDIFAAIINQLDDAGESESITGFFDRCEGCAVPERIAGIEPPQYRTRRLSPQPQMCDGRKVVDWNTGEPILTQKEGLEFWHCRNGRCYDPSRHTHRPDEWENYTLQDFLTILQIAFSPAFYELYLSFVNKIARFAEHLKCKQCHKTMKPVGPTNFAYWGVNRVRCETKGCSTCENGEVVYISHCSNGNCEGIIDSRESARCKPEGYSAESCGWYVCKECNACCSTSALANKRTSYEERRQDWRCHKHSHQERGEICCFQCGTIMQALTKGPQYADRLVWLRANAGNHPFIGRHGHSNYYGYWWVIQRNGMEAQQFHGEVTGFIGQGFKASNYRAGEQTCLISEASTAASTSLICNGCGAIKDLKKDNSHWWSMFHYHRIAFERMGLDRPSRAAQV